ncbi:hypothetical protein DOS86_00965 [Anaplasma marginale]|nr:hypothetical protein DOS86_00965 [Anaplasma marginale]
MPALSNESGYSRLVDPLLVDVSIGQFPAAALQGNSPKRNAHRLQLRAGREGLFVVGCSFWLLTVGFYSSVVAH